MKINKIDVKIVLLIGLLLLSTKTFSGNPNFHIYLCFGQSNMEGQGTIEAQDKTVDSRFKVLQSLDCSGRSKGTWYPAIPPLCQCNSGLSPADYFGRTMVKYLPDSITVGVINVAVGGSDIRLFDKDLYQNYDSTYTDEWFLSKLKSYGGNPRKHLMDLAKLAQQDGVIKGFLIHQGEANSGDSKWPLYVKKVYEEMLSELLLSADTVPLLAGEVLSEPGSCCGTWMNPVINKLPMTIPTAHVISANELTGMDPAHFNSASYRTFGIRYATKMLSLMGIGAKVFEPETYYFEPECSSLGVNWNLVTDRTSSNNTYVTIKNGLNNLTQASDDRANAIHFDFSAKSDTTFFLYGRVYCPTLKSDSYWVKMDNGAFEYVNGLTTSIWSWKKLKSYNLKAGHHTLTIANGEEGARLDKIVISNVDIAPSGMGETAMKVCNPVVYSFPGTIEAESYLYQTGVTTATTKDIAGGMDAGSLDTNDWLEYMVDVALDTVYRATFRYASAASGAFSVLLDDVNVGSVFFAGTGNLQTYKAFSKDIPLKAGRHTLKLLVTTGGFNMNWFVFEKVTATGMNEVYEGGLSVYPNPTNGELNIESDTFQFDDIAIVDCSGKGVFSRNVDSTRRIRFNPNLSKGIYMLILSNDTENQDIKIIVN